MKHHLLKALFAFLFMYSCSNNPQQLLERAQDKLLSQEAIQYRMLGLYPNPMGEIDTVEAVSDYRKNESSITGYDFILKTKTGDLINIDGVFKSVNHRDQSVEFFPTNKADKETAYIHSQRYIEYSPLTLLGKGGWEFIGDSLMDGKSIADYYRVETDTVVDGNSIYTEEHIFIDPASKFVDRFERRVYYKGNHAQTLTYLYSDYTLVEANAPLAYNYPADYKSVLLGEAPVVNTLKVGDQAPFFISKDLQSQALDLKDYEGKKILLNFSVINCGYCKQALDHFNREDYQLSEDIAAFYVNPIDEQKDLVKYTGLVNIPFPVIPEAKEIANLYGVPFYPIFFLIDEDGIIEQVVAGYDKEFLASLEG